MAKWNLSKKQVKIIIIKSLLLLFNLNYNNILPIQYICKNLNYYFKKENIILLFNKKRRNINTYIKKEYHGIYNLIKNHLSNYFKIKKNFLILIKCD